MKLVLRTFILAISLAMLIPLAPTSAAERDHIILAQAALTAEDAAELVRARVGGRVLSVKPIQSDGRLVYRVKVLTRKGAIRIFYVDANTGDM
jgi:uncharacterized membrane protein YkoI